MIDHAIPFRHAINAQIHAAAGTRESAERKSIFGPPP
jgi:hypothetical protein